MITLEQTEEWLQDQEPSYTYEFCGKTYHATWWDGELLGDHVALDLETSVTNHEDIRLACVFDSKNLFYVHPNRIKELFKQLDEPHRKVVCHNSTFDIVNLCAFAGEMKNPVEWVKQGKVHDTLALARLVSLAEGLPYAPNDLGSVSKKYLGLELPKEVSITPPGAEKPKKVALSFGDYDDVRQMPAAALHYCAFDTLASALCLKPLRAMASKLAEKHGADPGKLLSYETLVKTMIAGGLTSYHGIAVDQNLVEANASRLKEEMKEYERILNDEGYYPGSNEKGIKDKLDDILDVIAKNEGISLTKYYHRSRKKIVHSTRENDLRQFKHIPFINALCNFERIRKQLSTFVEPMLGKERVHSSYLAGKTTGRVSSKNPNMQNIPRSSQVREQFVAGPGKKFVIADYTAAELQAIAQYCLDNYGVSKLGELLNAGIDVHRYVASRYLGKPEKELTKDERSAGKPFNFGRLGGSGPATLQSVALNTYGVSLTLEETRKLIEIWDIEFPEAGCHFREANNALAKAWSTNRSGAYKISMTLKDNPSNRLSDSEINWAWGEIKRIVSEYPQLEQHEEAVESKTTSTILVRDMERLRVAKLPSGRLRGGCSYTEWCNNAMQGHQSDITNETWFELHAAGLKVVNSIHDEFIIECPEDLAIETQKQVEKIMLTVAKRFNPSMSKMSVESAITDTWRKV